MDRIVTVEAPSGAVLFNCPSQISFQRATHLLKKEPGTIAWIDGFNPGERLWDIGANIGLYSLYAAVTKGCEVIAVEPAAANFFSLNTNIILNKVDTLVRGLCVAINDSCCFSTMRMRDNEIGSALHVFSSNVDYGGQVFTPAWQQGALGIPIDTLCETFGVSPPHHVKIDVDGLEVAVIKSGRRTFINRSLRSVLVEVDLNDSHEIGEIASVLKDCGLAHDCYAPSNQARQHPNGSLIGNLIFRRIP